MTITTLLFSYLAEVINQGLRKINNIPVGVTLQIRKFSFLLAIMMTSMLVLALCIVQALNLIGVMLDLSGGITLTGSLFLFLSGIIVSTLIFTITFKKSVWLAQGKTSSFLFFSNKKIRVNNIWEEAASLMLKEYIREKEFQREMSRSNYQSELVGKGPTTEEEKAPLVSSAQWTH